MTTAALLVALAVHKVSERGGDGGEKWPTSTGHAEIQGPGMRNWQVAEDPRDSFLLSSPEVLHEDRKEDVLTPGELRWK